jgi:ribosomal protein L15
MLDRGDVDRMRSTGFLRRGSAAAEKHTKAGRGENGQIDRTRHERIPLEGNPQIIATIVTA